MTTWSIDSFCEYVKRNQNFYGIYYIYFYFENIKKFRDIVLLGDPPTFQTNISKTKKNCRRQKIDTKTIET